MANIRIKEALERISTDLDRVAHHAAVYSGVSKEHAMAVDTLATSIAQTAASISAIARATQGDRSADKLVKNVRKSLGFTKP